MDRIPADGENFKEEAGLSLLSSPLILISATSKQEGGRNNDQGREVGVSMEDGVSRPWNKRFAQSSGKESAGKGGSPVDLGGFPMSSDLDQFLRLGFPKEASSPDPGEYSLPTTLSLREGRRWLSLPQAVVPVRGRVLG